MGTLDKSEISKIESILKANRAIKTSGSGQYFEHIVKADAVKLYKLLSQ